MSKIDGKIRIKVKKYRSKDAGSEIYKIGLCRQNVNSSNKERTIHKFSKYFITIIPITFIIKSIILLILEQRGANDTNSHVYFGDFFYELPNVRVHATVGTLMAAIYLFLTQLLYYFLWTSGKMREIPMAKLFQVFVGKLSTKVLNMHSKDVVKLMKW